MKIADSAVQLYSQYSAVEKNDKQESLTVWNGGQERREVADAADIGRELVSLRKQDLAMATKVSLSSEARQMDVGGLQAGAAATESGRDVTDLNLRILQLLIERLTGRKVSTTDIAAMLQAEKARTPVASASGQSAPVRPAGFGAVYEYHETRFEAETVSFAAQGKVHTADGREIDFSAQLQMSRAFSSRIDNTVRIGEALKDPLVVNFNGSAAQLTAQQFVFDLNADGRDELISFVGPESGFLALDKNGDQTINNGTELFGPGTGNGFSELAAYDSDGNNWIDENDPVFANLRIWMKDPSGSDRLFSLGQMGVGALFLGNAATPFSVKDQQNELLGQVRSTGVFLQENGAVGTLQQIDLVA